MFHKFRLKMHAAPFNTLLLISNSLVMHFTPVNSAEQPYHPKDIELRPWTNTRAGSGGTIEKRIPFHFMELTLRDFMDNCDGQCFYHAGNSSTPSDSSCDPKKRDCFLAVSIARHGSAQCPFLGEALGNMNATICDASSPDKQFYSVSIIRHVKTYSCHNTPRLFHLHMPCAPSEFVAISFYPDGHPSALDDKDRWYVCTAGEHWISYWENVVTTPTQIKVSTPYNSSAPGVIDYRSKYDEVSKSFVCKFIISAEELNKDTNKLVDFPETSESSGSSVKVKLAQGRVKRTTLDPDKIPASLTEKKRFKTEVEQALERKYFMAQNNLEKPVFTDSSDPDDKDGETIFADTFIGPSPDTINFKELAITLKSVHTIHTQSEHEEDEKAIVKQIQRCNSDKEVGKLKCFYPNNEKSCIFRQRCKVLLLAEEVPYNGKKVLQLSLISFSPVDRSIKTTIRPRGWAAMGFSKDYKMGNDLVVACTFIDETDADIVVSWNAGHNNKFNMTYNQNLIFDKEKIRFIQKKSGDSVLCRWKMDWKFTVERGVYWTPPKEEFPEEDFDLEKYPGGMFILFAKGPHVYNGHRISYHDFNEVIEVRFNPNKYFRGKNDGNKLSPLHSITIVIVGIMYNFLAKW